MSHGNRLGWGALFEEFNGCINKLAFGVTSNMWYDVLDPGKYQFDYQFIIKIGKEPFHT